MRLVLRVPRALYRRAGVVDQSGVHCTNSAVAARSAVRSAEAESLPADICSPAYRQEAKILKRVDGRRHVAGLVQDGAETLQPDASD